MNAKIFNYILILITLLVIPWLVWQAITLTTVDVVTLLGIAIVIPSMILLIIARFQLGSSFSLSAQAKELRTTGLYSKLRHPVYVFGQLLLLGLVLCIKAPMFFLAWGLLVVMQILRAKREEEVLEAKFGDEYREYKKRTWF